MNDIQSRICGILDLELFSHKKMEKIREVGFVQCADLNTKAVNIQVKCSLPLHIPEYRRTFNLQKYNVHGLDFVPIGENHVAESAVEPIILNLYNVLRTDERRHIAFKGGLIEKKILNSLDIPWIDLESIPEFPTFRKSVRLEDINYSCGNHLHSPCGVYHCASAETLYYRDVLMKK